MLETKNLIEKLKLFADMLGVMQQNISEITEMLEATELTLEGVAVADTMHDSQEFKELLADCAKLNKLYNSLAVNHYTAVEKLKDFSTLCSRYKVDILPISKTALTWLKEDEIRSVCDLVTFSQKSSLCELYGIGPVYREEISRVLNRLFNTASMANCSIRPQYQPNKK